jgi:para-aminobenzoate synthetase/4-amino-4-deoxychorismate lyase
MKRRSTLPGTASTLVDRLPGSVLLECASPAGDAAGWSRLFVSPLRTLIAHTPDELHLLLAELEKAAAAGLTAAGFLSYETGSCFEPRAGLIAPSPDEPLAWFGIYPRSYPFDPATGSFPQGAPPELAGIARIPAKAAPVVRTWLPISAGEYAGKIEAIHAWIRSGDVYQLNYTLPLEVSVEGCLGALYRELIRRQPVAYGAFVHWKPGRRILSISPELFFRIDEQDGERHIVTRPMKGTVARGRTTAEDRAQAQWLQRDEKNRAENLMIVDLLRNDVGRLARFGSVRVEEMFAVERHPTLWQMTSTVTAQLRPGTSVADVLRALFPCGSITGAPKVRAMQLLAELEAWPRGVYTGSIGFIEGGKAAFNVAIRTLEFEGNQGQMGIGSGVVIDSDPAAEYAECQLKARFLTEPAPEFQLLESLLWQGGYPRLELHLDRLEDSAGYFGFACDRGAVEAALGEHARSLPSGAARKVRLLLDRDGAVRISSELLPEDGDPASPVRICIARERTDSADRFLFHKTTQRALYTRAFAEAQRLGYGEVLFFNQRGELTEGAISNVFLERNGRWFTPSVACGLLAGVERRYLLAARPEIEERVLTAEDLKTANRIWLSNAVRGLRLAQVTGTL